jgi:Ca2+-binding RTX toxin-like protein
MSQATAEEQYILELINAERAKVGAQPLAFNFDLNESAETHSKWMLATDTFSHTGASGTNAGARMTAAGYKFTDGWGWGENLALRSTGGAVGYQDEILAMHAGLMNSPGHKANILKATYREVGVGVEIGEYKGMNCAFATQNFAYAGSGYFVTGVAFDDQDGDRSYDIGEGLGGLTVSMVNSLGVTYSTTSMIGGGYQMNAPAGTYTINFSGAGIAATTRTVTLASQNVKLDLMDPALGPIMGDAGANTLTGTSGADNIQGMAGRDLIIGGLGKDTINGGMGIDIALYSEKTTSVVVTLNGGVATRVFVGGVAEDSIRSIENVTSGSGADRLTGDYLANVLKSGLGADTLSGRGGADDLYAGADNVRDHFLFSAASDSGTTAATWDQLFQFDRSLSTSDMTSDRIDLRSLDADPATGDQAFRFVTEFATAKSTQVDGQVRVVDVGSHVNVEIDMNGDISADIVVQVMNVAALTGRDFLL